MLFRPTFGCDLSSETGRERKRQRSFETQSFNSLADPFAILDGVVFLRQTGSLIEKLVRFGFVFLWFWDSIFLSCVRFSNQMIYCVTFSPSDELHMGIILMIRFCSSSFSRWASSHRVRCTHQTLQIVANGGSEWASSREREREIDWEMKKLHLYSMHRSIINNDHTLFFDQNT